MLNHWKWADQSIPLVPLQNQTISAPLLLAQRNINGTAIVNY
jgi:hypothetical protein